MNSWYYFELINQYLFSNLLKNTHQKEFFLKTNIEHEKLFKNLIFNILKPDMLVEVGAYEASFSYQYSKINSMSQVFAFEADPENFNHFTSSFENKKNFNYLNAIVSNEKKDYLNFYKKIDSSLVSNNSIFKKKNQLYNVVTIKNIRLDEFFENLISSVNNISLRIDAEGGAYDVLKSGQNLLKKTSAIYVEVEDYEVWQNQKTVFDIYPFLEEFDFVPFTRDFQTPGQYNVFFIKKNLSLDRKFRAHLVNYISKILEISNSIKI